ncbi:MAG: hypothetical protein LWX07_01235 [Bacteroidetes bacterium]|nr:hypothetical protein [Bacteroidota bacterium]
MKLLLYIILFLSAVFCSCNKSDSLFTGPETNAVYLKLYSAVNDSVRFDVYSASNYEMQYGYNDIGFRVFVNGAEKKTGYVKYLPMMYHDVGGPGHSSPVSEKYYYSSEYDMFTGYACFTMLSDSSAFWFANYNYNDELAADSVFFRVIYTAGRQLSYWDDIYGGNTYCLTLVKPMASVIGSNVFTVILHRTTDDKHFYEVDSAEMRLKTYLETGGSVSSGGLNPVWKGGGMYEGSVNFNKTGTWHVQDTIYYHNNKITKTNPPDFVFTAD